MKLFPHLFLSAILNLSENSELSHKSAHRVSRGQIKISVVKAFLISHVSRRRGKFGIFKGNLICGLKYWPMMKIVHGMNNVYNVIARSFLRT